MNLRLSRFIFFGLILLLPGMAAAQECRCCKKRDEGQVLYNAKKYAEAIEKWKTARQLSDAGEKCKNLDALIKEARTHIPPKPVPPKKPKTSSVASFLVKIPGGTFTMGNLFGDGSVVTMIAHKVTLSDFYISKYEVSFDEFDAFCVFTKREKPFDEGWGRGKRPVINIDWYDAVEYCNWLSEQQGLSTVYSIDKTVDINNKDTSDPKKWTVKANWQANGYRLPTEAEWEYAARAARNASVVAQGGRKVRFGNGRDIIDPAEINFKASKEYAYLYYSVLGEYRQKTVPVDELSANCFGLKNMSGNVNEWCWDWYDDEFYKKSEGSQDPKGASSGSTRVFRGGSWMDYPGFCVADYRFSFRPHIRYKSIGFRVARRL